MDLKRRTAKFIPTAQYGADITSLKNMFFVVRNGHYQEFSHIACIPLLHTYI